MLTREEALAIYQAGPQTVVPVFLEMAARIHALEQRVEELQAQVQPLQDQRRPRTRATAASRPPAMELHKPSPKSLRQKGQRQSGGQPGHKGHTLKRVEKPDRFEVHRWTRASAAVVRWAISHPSRSRNDKSTTCPPGRGWSPSIRPKSLCSCGHRNQGAFPDRGQRPGAIRSLRPGRGRLFEQLSVPAL